ncbi:hypothetical protein [Pseudomonas veronii]|uniref:Uncharacterized protein n=1 Tax=Pseudomonas veronii TaxID=76761 RepID=A0A6B9XKG1_PSEVE|nr:hypothetical protein [Pseudomonas veronii]QHR77753.1 hypothetical protein E4167_35510 [Pseudomonas veronii]
MREQHSLSELVSDRLPTLLKQQKNWSACSAVPNRSTVKSSGLVVRISPRIM